MCNLRVACLLDTARAKRNPQVAVFVTSSALLYDRAANGEHPSTLITLDDVRRFAVAHSLFSKTTLRRAVERLRFVQADPIRAPARAEDLVLRHRVEGYRAGDIYRRYAKLGIEEDTFVNYGFVTRSLQALMHPRPDASN